MAKKLTDEQKRSNKLLRKCKKLREENKDYLLEIKLNHIITTIEKGLNTDTSILEEMLKGAIKFKGDFK